MVGTRHYGKGSRFTARPEYKEWDFAVYKSTNLTERVNLQLRADIFNVVNHPEFRQPVPAGVHRGRRGGRFSAWRHWNPEVVVAGLNRITATGDVVSGTHSWEGARREESSWQPSLLFKGRPATETKS